MEKVLPEVTQKERNRRSFDIKGPSIFTDAPEDEEVPDKTDYMYIPKTSDDMLRFKPNIHKLVEERVQEVSLKDKGGQVDPFIRECLHIFNGTYNVLVCEEEFAKTPKEDNFKPLVKKETVHPNSFADMRTNFCFKNHFFNLEIGLVEPLFCSVQIIDIQSQEVMSEKFFFMVANFQVINEYYEEMEMKNTLMNLDPQPKAIFSVSEPNPNLYLLLQVNKLAQNAKTDAIWKLYKNTKEKSVLMAKIIEQCPFTDATQPFLWAYSPLFKQTDLKINDGVYAFKYLYPVEKPFDYFSMIKDGAKDGQLKKLKPLEGICVYELFNFSPQKFENNILERTLFFEKRDANYLRFKTYDESIRIVMEMNQSFSDATKEKIKNNVIADIDPKIYLKYQKLELLSSPKKPMFSFIHTLFVHLDTVNLIGVEKSNTKPKNFNVQIECRLIQAGLKNEEIAAFESIFDQLVTVAQSTVTFQSPNPTFGDEVKIQLPLPIQENHFLLFTFYHVPLEREDKKRGEKELLGSSLMSLKSILEAKSDTHALNVFKSIPSDFQDLTDAPLHNPKICFFKFRAKLISTIYPQEKTLLNFFNDCALFLNLDEKSRNDMKLIAKSILKAKKAMNELKKTSITKLISHFTIILDFIFSIMCRSSDVLNLLTSEEKPTQRGGNRRSGLGSISTDMTQKRRTSIVLESNKDHFGDRDFTLNPQNKEEKRKSTVTLNLPSDGRSVSHKGPEDSPNISNLHNSQEKPRNSSEKGSSGRRFSFFTGPNSQPKQNDPRLRASSRVDGLKNVLTSFWGKKTESPVPSTNSTTSEDYREITPENEEEMITIDYITMSQNVFDLQSLTFDVLIYMLKGACEFMDEFDRQNVLLSSYVQYVFKDVLLSKNPLYITLTERWTDLIQKDEEASKQAPRTVFGPVGRQKLKESNNLCVNSLQFSWFLFDLIMKSFIINRPPDGGGRYQGQLISLMKAIGEKVVQYSVDPVFYQLSDYINEQLGVFFKTLSYDMKQSFVFELMDSYLQTIVSQSKRMARNNPTFAKDYNNSLIFLMITFTKYLFDNDQIIPLNNPDYFPHDNKDSLVCPPVRLLILVIQRWNVYMKSPNETEWDKKIKDQVTLQVSDLFNYITTKHKVDVRYQKKHHLEMIARIYFPVIIGIMNCDIKMNDSMYRFVMFVLQNVNSEFLSDYVIKSDSTYFLFKLFITLLETEEVKDKSDLVTIVVNSMINYYPHVKEVIFTSVTDVVSQDNLLECYLYLFAQLVKKFVEVPTLLKEDWKNLLIEFSTKDMGTTYWRWLYATILQAKQFGVETFVYSKVKETLENLVVIPPTIDVIFEEDSDANIEYVQVDQNKEIKGATLDKLVEKLFVKQAGNYTKQFFLTYRSFTTPQELLDQLIQRFRQEKNEVASLRIFNSIKQWQEQYFYDFDNALIIKLIRFLETVKNTNTANIIRQRLEKNMFASKKDSLLSFSSPPPNPIIPKDLKASTMLFDLTKWDPLEIARQMCLIDYGIFSKIQPNECFGLRWTKKDKDVISPNIVAFTKRLNDMSYWFATILVKEEDLKQRIRLLSQIIKIAQICDEQLHNFNGVVTITSALNNAAVHRLKKTFDGLPKDLKQKLDDLNDLVATTGSYAKLREAFKCNPPTIPYLGVFLTDLTFIEDGSPNKFKNNGLINFSKRRQFADVLLKIEVLQQSPYNLTVVKQLSYTLSEFTDIWEDADLFKQSLKIEPREKTN